MPLVVDSTARLLVVVITGIALTLFLAAWLIGATRRRDLMLQVAAIAPAWLAYFIVRGLTEGDVSSAVARARSLADLERTFGIHVEPWLNEVTSSSEALTATANMVYIWGHWPLIFIVAIWLLWRHPVSFRRYKRAFLVSGAIGLLFFALLPTAPPRLAGSEFIDTVTAHSQSYRVFQPPMLTNQYAAFPSLHVGWNLLIGIALVRNASALPGRLLGVLSPLAMALAAVATANHYVIDVVAGSILAMFGLALVVEWERDIIRGWWRRVWDGLGPIRPSGRPGTLDRWPHHRVPVGDHAVDAPRDQLVEASTGVHGPGEDGRRELAQHRDAGRCEPSLVDADAVRDAIAQPLRDRPQHALVPDRVDDAHVVDV